MASIGRARGRRCILIGLFLVASVAVYVPLAPAQADPPSRVPKPATGRLSSRLAGAGLPASRIPDNRPGGLRRLGDGRVVTDVRVDDNREPMQHRLRAAGAEVLSVSDPRYRTVTIATHEGDLRTLSELPGVENVKEVLAPLARACGPIISEGDSQLKAAAARADFGVDGTGVTVGIVSDSFDRSPPGAATNASQDVAAGDLPGPGNPCGRPAAVNKVDDSAAGSLIDEGRAMAQTVHDLAPGAGIAFATGVVSETSMANNITNLVSAGADVIVDDLVYLQEPFYQDGPIAVAINQARAAGVPVFSAAGNSHMTLAGKPVGSYEAQTYRATACPSLPATFLDCHNFNPSGSDRTYRMTIPSDGFLALDLQWAQPRGGVTTDLDICILDANTGTILACGADYNSGPTGTQVPFEGVGFTNDSGSARAVNVIVARYEGPPVRFKWIHLGDKPSSVEYSTTVGSDVYGPTVWGHAGAASAFGVGAVPYFDSSSPEPYSSHGPMTILFNPVPSTTTLASPQVLSKPDMAATDCVQNSFWPPGSSSPHRFCGTSNSAPHAAAVAALMLDRAPSATPTQIRATLQATADPVGTAPATAVGAGLIDAQAAVGALVGTVPSVRGDYDLDQKTDLAVYRPAQGLWFVQRSGGGAASVPWGTSGDITVPADYDGDGKTDVAVFRPAQGLWFVQRSSGGTATTAWGTNGDIPVPADYDGDGKVDLAVYRPAQGLWFVSRSGGGGTATTAWGTTGDVPVPSDYDGDGQADVAVYRPAQGLWFVSRSGGGSGITAWGTNGDIPVPTDYDSDGQADLAVFRPAQGLWFVSRSSGGSGITAWGTNGDVPVPGDYDGDGTADLAVFRPAQGLWFVSRSGGGSGITAWGTNGDVALPLPSAIRLVFFP